MPPRSPQTDAPVGEATVRGLLEGGRLGERHGRSDAQRVQRDSDRQGHEPR